MTLQEAQKQIDTCEQQIISTYGDLKNNMRDAGENAVEIASRNVTKNTALPLGISLAVVAVCFVINIFLGIAAIVVCAVIIYNQRSKALWNRGVARKARDNMNIVLDYNSQI